MLLCKKVYVNILNLWHYTGVPLMYEQNNGLLNWAHYIQNPVSFFSAPLSVEISLT